MRKYESIGEGLDCPKCSKPMERREHRFISEKILKQPYYFREWDYCKPCGHLQHYEDKKIFNDPYLKEVEEEIEQMDTLFKDITS